MVHAVATSPIPRAVVPAFLTERPGRFAVRELRGGRRLARHTLRGEPWSFCVHHGSADASVLAEVFRARYYAIPPEVEACFEGLDRPLRVVDLGAHVGLFGLWTLLAHPDAEIVAYEPDPLNFAALSCTIAINGLRAAGWQAIQACAAGADGTRRFAAGGSSSARVLAEDETGGEMVNARDAFAHLRNADLVKVDVEGGEWDLLSDPRFAEIAPSMLFLEYHRHLCPAPDPRRHTIQVLEGAGYRVTEVFSTPDVGLLRATRVSAG